MPALALGVNMLGILMRVTRSAILEVMNEEYVTTARAKGVSENKVVWRHVTSNALIPVITVVGLELGTLLSGSIIVETVFAWPGLGQLFFDAISNQDLQVECFQGSPYDDASAYIANGNETLVRMLQRAG